MGGCLLSVMYVMFVLCTLRACIAKIAVRRRMFCTYVICVYSATCAELWLMLFSCLRSGVTICGPKERRNVHNEMSKTFQMTL